MSYDGSSLSEWLAEYRSRRPLTEVALFEAVLPQPVYEGSRCVVALRIARCEDPDNPKPDRGIYLVGARVLGVLDRFVPRVADGLALVRDGE
jgi:hypothetical protein